MSANISSSLPSRSEELVELMTEEDEDKDDDRDDELEDEDEDDPAPVLGVFVGLCVCDFPPPLLEGVGVLGVVRLGGIAAAEFYRRISFDRIFCL
jgi:hypothetical protein